MEVQVIFITFEIPLLRALINFIFFPQKSSELSLQPPSPCSAIQRHLLAPWSVHVPHLPMSLQDSGINPISDHGFSQLLHGCRTFRSHPLAALMPARDLI